MNANVHAQMRQTKYHARFRFDGRPTTHLGPETFASSAIPSVHHFDSFFPCTRVTGRVGCIASRDEARL